MSSRLISDLSSLQTTINGHWQPIHVWLVQRRSWSQPVMRLATILTLTVLILSGVIYLWAPGSYYLVSGLGVKLANLAISFYVLSLVPGILKRLDILAMPRASLMLFRRELGNLAFLTALCHGLLVRLLPKFLNPLLMGVIPPVSEIIGLIALLALIPLYVTSSDKMVTKLGPLWQKVHSITYLILGLLIFHTAWFSFQTSLILAFVGIMEIASYTKATWIGYLPSTGTKL